MKRKIKKVNWKARAEIAEKLIENMFYGSADGKIRTNCDYNVVPECYAKIIRKHMLCIM